MDPTSSLETAAHFAVFARPTQKVDLELAGQREPDHRPNLARNEPPGEPDQRPIDVTEEGAEARMWSVPPADFAASIRQAIETLSCGEDYPTIRTTAEFLDMSVRTLQRRLAQAGTSHHRLVAQARFATAAAVLERTDAQILKLALDLGYSDPGNFTRAFRRWAGCAPRQYRLARGATRRGLTISA